MKNRPILKSVAMLTLATISLFSLFTSCEGPAGIAGKDANESCIECHNSEVVSLTSNQFVHSLHAEGEAFEEGTRAACAPCHSNEGFLYVSKNNTPVTFVADPVNAGKFLNNYQIPASETAFPGPISCFTCHSSLHTTYTVADLMPLTNEAAVPMTMYGGAKSINFTQTSGNLCAKCHQPRPVTASSGNLIDYAKLISEPTTTYSLSSIGYRTGIHYGAQGAIASGVGGIEFGTGYTNSDHAADASCSSCHMAAPSGFTGGHSFNVAGNFAGCTTCHSSGMSATNATYLAVTNDINTLLTSLAAEINAIGGGHDILQKDPEDNKYHGYIDIYDASANPNGYWKNPANGTPAFPALTNAQFGAIINYQLAFRDGSKGIHNYPYVKKLLENTLAAI